MPSFTFRMGVPRDERREEYCHQLKRIGVDAYLAERGIPEEQYSRSCWRRFGYGDSLGLIELRGETTPYVNIVRQSSKYGSHYYAEYIVPDTRLSDRFKKLSVKINFERGFPVVGRRKRAYWKGNDLSTGLIRQLERDEETTAVAMSFPRDRYPFSIKPFPRHDLWVIRSSANRPVTREIFDANQRIAQSLLDTLIY